MITTMQREAPTVLPEARPFLKLHGISKSFVGMKALSDVSLSVWPGEIHMLLGGNRAGKSTLMKVVCGAVRTDAGSFAHHGQPVGIASPADAVCLGIAVIFREFSLVPYLDIAQNIFFGRAFKSRVPSKLDRPRLEREATRVLESIGFEIDPRRKVHTLGVTQQQMVEIAKALSQNACILVMDEPTAALSEREADQLFAIIHRLRADGVAIIYISHRIAEVFALGDHITVLRDDQLVRTLLPAEATPEELVRLMMDRPVSMTYPRHFRALGPVILDVKGLSAANGIADISLELREGEIVGLCGLVGSGRTEAARAIFGADPVTSGQVRVFGRLHTGGPDVSARFGMALIPESRKTEGLALIRSVGDNLVLAGLHRLFSHRTFRPAVARACARDIVEKLRIGTASTLRSVRTLSGNQQKVVIGKLSAALGMNRYPRWSARTRWHQQRQSDAIRNAPARRRCPVWDDIAKQ